MPKNDAVRYEDFIKVAFGIQKGCIIERREDPAGLAEADYFRDLNNLPQVKTGVAYAIEIYNNYMLSNFADKIDPDDFEAMRSMTEKVLAASSHDEIIQLIDEFEKYIAKYCIKYSDLVIFQLVYA